MRICLQSCKTTENYVGLNSEDRLLNFLHYFVTPSSEGLRVCIQDDLNTQDAFNISESTV